MAVLNVFGQTTVMIRTPSLTASKLAETLQHNSSFEITYSNPSGLQPLKVSSQRVLAKFFFKISFITFSATPIPSPKASHFFHLVLYTSGTKKVSVHILPSVTEELHLQATASTLSFSNLCPLISTDWVIFFNQHSN